MLEIEDSLWRTLAFDEKYAYSNVRLGTSVFHY